MLRRTPGVFNAHLRTLGLDESRHFSAVEIKQAYREQTKIHHPDVGGDPEKFKNICNAYNVLSGKAFADTVGKGNDFYSSAQSSNPHWEYYYGTSRTRDTEEAAERSQHGKHGAQWANHGGASANYSTRDFYRPYESMGKSGFTNEELRAAERATRLHLTWRAIKKMALIIGLYCCYVTYRNERVDSNERARQQGYSEAYWEMRRKDKAEGLDVPKLSSFYERKRDELEEARLANEKRRKALGIRNAFDAPPAGPTAVTFRGQPFTTEGLAAARREKRGGPSSLTGPAAVDLTGIDDLSYEVDDADMPPCALVR